MACARSPVCLVAGVIARTDARRGVWNAPAGVDAVLDGVTGLSVEMTDAENGLLNPLGINCLRSFPTHRCVVWGARTLRGADAAADEYTYVPVRRTALFIEESLDRGLTWVDRRLGTDRSPSGPSAGPEPAHFRQRGAPTVVERRGGTR